MRKFPAIAFALCTLANAQTGTAPKTMTKMVVVLQSPDAPAGSFAAQPKTMFRAGTSYCRVEEAVDEARGIHGVAITNEPNAWLVNLMDASAKHMVDPGPTFNCHLPIFPFLMQKLSAEHAKKVMALEFGYELPYFKQNGATPQPGPVLQTKQTTLYSVKVGDATLALFTYGTPERPLCVVWTHADEHDIFWYSGYGEMDFDPKLFAKPQHVTIEETTP